MINHWVMILIYLGMDQSTNQNHNLAHKFLLIQITQQCRTLFESSKSRGIILAVDLGIKPTSIRIHWDRLGVIYNYMQASYAAQFNAFFVFL